jgi:hypothetical protein
VRLGLRQVSQPRSLCLRIVLVILASKVSNIVVVVVVVDVSAVVRRVDLPPSFLKASSINSRSKQYPMASGK